MSFKHILTLFVSFLNVYCKLNYILPTNSNFSDVTKLSQCLMNIVVKNSYSKTTILSYETSNQENYVHSSIIINLVESFVKNGIPTAYLKNNTWQINKINHLYEGKSISITNVETCKTLYNVVELASNKNNKHLIIIQQILLTECKNTLNYLASKVANNDISFIFEDKIRNIFSIATYVNILGAEKCKMKNRMKLISLSNCRDTSNVEIFNIFPNKKPEDWMNCPIKVGLGSLYPYNKSYKKTLRNFDIVEMPHGSDVEILKILARSFNATVTFYNIKTEVENAYSEISYISWLVNGSLDVCAGGLYRIYGDIVSYSGIYSRQEIIWIYTVDRNKGWMALMRKTDEIYIFIVFCIFYTAICSIFCYFDEGVIPFTDTLWFAWGALFGGTSLQSASTVKQRILDLFYLLLCIHLYAYISIELYSFLTIQGPPHVYKNTDELSESGIPLYLIDNAKYFVDDEKYLTFANSSGSCKDFDNCVMKILSNEGTTILNDGLLGPLQTATAVNGEARVLKATEPILIVYHEMIIRKQSSLVGRFEKIISRLFEAGICQKLYEDSIGVVVIDKARRANQNMMANSYSCEAGCQITFTQSAGAFYAWMLGCVLSCFVFCLEIAIRTQIKNQYL